jgi:hypothetical protein
MGLKTDLQLKLINSITGYQVTKQAYHIYQAA